MKVQMYTIFDEKAQAHMQPFFMPNTAMAQRRFQDLVREDGNEVSRNPEDYHLCHVGEFDDETALLVPLTPISFLNQAIQFKVNDEE